MNRGFSSPAVTNALGSQHVRVITLAELGFGSGTVRVHNGLGQYTYDSQTWHGLGDLASISAVEEGSSISPYGVTLTVSSIDATLAEQALEEDYYQKPVKLYLGILDEDDTFVQESTPSDTRNPIEIWAGHIDQMTITAGAQGGDVIKIQCESELERFARSRNLMFTNAWQQSRYSNDKFFNLVHLIDGVKIRWKQSGTFVGGGAIDTPTPKPPQHYRH
jgi:hypothetical protein